MCRSSNHGCCSTPSPPFTLFEFLVSSHSPKDRGRACLGDWANGTNTQHHRVASQTSWTGGRCRVRPGFPPIARARGELRRPEARPWSISRWERPRSDLRATQKRPRSNPKATQKQPELGIWKSLSALCQPSEPTELPSLFFSALALGAIFIQRHSHQHCPSGPPIRHSSPFCAARGCCCSQRLTAA